MSGNMSKEGMTKDLEALSAAGEGGILLFNIAQGIPYGNVAYNSPEHHEIIAHAAKECERLECDNYGKYLNHSLGVQEHWNNPKDKKYSRNLRAGKGLELVYVDKTLN